jgi:hypothetical protein
MVSAKRPVEADLISTNSTTNHESFVTYVERSLARIGKIGLLVILSNQQSHQYTVGTFHPVQVSQE